MLNSTNTISAQPSVTLRLLVGTGMPGTNASTFEQNTNSADAPMTGKYFFARSASIADLARS
jgi:hypothetical protein